MSSDAPTGRDQTPVPTGLALTPFNPVFASDPQCVFDELRERDPVHEDKELHRIVLTRHDDVAAVLRDRTLSVDVRRAAPGSYLALFAGDLPEREPSILLMDPPDHTRLRRLVTKAFTPRAVDQLAPRICEVVDALLDAVSGREGFDLIAAFAGPLPTIVIAEMLGVDPADRERFKRWSDIGVMSFDPTLSADMRAEITSAQGELDACFRRVIAERRAEPRDDLISALIAAEEGGDMLNEEQIVTMCALLLAAGNVTTTDLIGNGVRALLEHPGRGGEAAR